MALIESEPQWPPRSPGEVLLSTPGGRARLRRLEASRTSPSPSRGERAGNHGFDDAAMGGAEGEDEDDEETLQLQLQEIQAKLRLKKLQAAKAQKVAAGESSTRSTPGSAKIAAGSGSATLHNPRSPQRSTVEVPASPVRRPQLAVEALTQKSPKRVLLGIDKGLRGQDVSLRRPPSSLRRGLTDSASSSSIEGGGSSSSLSQREPAPRPLSFNDRLAAARTQEAARQDKSERIQKLRTSGFDVGREEMDQYKAKAVDIPVVERGPQKFSRDDILGAASGRKQYDADSGSLRRSNTTPNIRSKYMDEGVSEGAKKDTATAEPDEASFEPYSGFHLTRRNLPHSVVARSVSGKTAYTIKDLLRLVKAPHFELPQVETDVVVWGIIAEKSDPRSHKPAGSAAGPAASQDRGKYMVLTLVDLTYQVELFLFKSGFERFWKLSTGTVVAILNPSIMPPPPGRHDTGKWSLVINSDDDTILEIGNARDLGYCKSIKRDGHQCSTWVNAKRTEFCEFHTNEAAKKMRATRNDLNGAAGFGTSDKSTRGGRGGGRGGGGRGRGGGDYSSGRGGKSNTGYDYMTQSQWFAAGSSASSLIDNEALNGGYSDQMERKEGLKRRLAAKERESDIARKLSEIGTGAGKDYMKLAGRGPTTTKKGSSSSTTSSFSTTRSSQQSQLSSSSSMTTVGSAAEQAAASRASLLASVVGRRSVASTTGIGNSGLHIRDNTPKLDQEPPPTTVHLGPAKRKRPQSALSSSVAGTSNTNTGSAPSQSQSGEGFGWGTNLKAKLGRMKDGERLNNNQTIQNGFKRQAGTATAGSTLTSSASTPILPAPERSPVRKKTRFLLGGKGIREAGRESLGTTAPSNVDFDDDEDELVII
ncbi:hypothetical protein HMPREF1624_07029 [Sporothrix schenckii ATCC 58251]|uniref:Uncharacterized protein n=1 Tax=Sporothrix schenckii (strain ATCC 58251 / de Perez 2211183) TaxID=1391915 RepID=U7PQP1_SPOS1|nr:hypothetical protein HMPREF1624_07029 [Sporothrix schenckii ATCC 58251]